MQEITINTEYIKLTQLLKLAGIVSMGSEVKSLIDDGKITINGMSVTELRKKVYVNDIVNIDGEEIAVCI